ncbi:glycoside hydrolase superfamily [Xylariaceae sp. FL0255]|nr:glycoside hydrolase superfamily [Xylariaceae sp. FL0255]
MYSVRSAKDYNFTLSIALSVNLKTCQQIKVPELNHHVDLFHLLAYDMAGVWDIIAVHQVNLYPNPNDNATTPFNASDTFHYLLDEAHIPPQKTTLSMPLYGRLVSKHNCSRQVFQGSWKGKLGEGGL